MSDLTEAQKRAVKMLMDVVVDMGTYLDTPDMRKDPVWLALYAQGGEALRAAGEAGLKNQ